MVYDDCKTQYVGKPWCLIGNQTGDYLDYSSCAPCDEEKYVLHDMTNYQYKTINHDPAIGQGLLKLNKKVQIFVLNFIYAKINAFKNRLIYYRCFQLIG